MRSQFVETQNYHRFLDAVSALQMRGADECRFIVVDGEPGLGKTTIVHRWAATNSSLYLRADPEWDMSWFISEALTACQASIPHRVMDRTNKLKEELGTRRRAAEAIDRPFAVIIDEADEITRKSSVV